MADYGTRSSAAGRDGDHGGGASARRRDSWRVGATEKQLGRHGVAVFLGVGTGEFVLGEEARNPGQRARRGGEEAEEEDRPLLEEIGGGERERLNGVCLM
jgi:hypothetical protein